MKKVQFFKVAAIGMLVLNIAMITFFLLTRHRPGHPDRGARFHTKAVEILHLDDAQTTRFDEMAHQHHETMEELKSRQSEQLKPFFEEITQGGNSNPDAVPQEFLDLEKSKVSVTYRHFLEVKALLKPEQKGYFAEYMKEALEVVLLSQKAAKSPPPKVGK